MSVAFPLTFAIVGVFMIVAAQQIGRDAQRIRPIGGMTPWGARAIGIALLLGAIALLAGAP